MDDELDNISAPVPTKVAYDANAIKTLSSLEHIRHRPGMYIGKLGDGTYENDGVYVLVKEVIDNSVDEFIMGCGRRIDVTKSATTDEAFRWRSLWTAFPRSTRARNTTATFSSSPSA